MKQGKKNNAFTAALNKEISTRKVLEKAKDNAENKILLSEMSRGFEPETIAEPIDSTKPIPQIETDPPIKPVKRSKDKIKKSLTEKSAAKKNSAKKISAEKVAAEKVTVSKKLEPESEFEKRIFAEAENDFYDEKIPQNIGKNMRSKITEKIIDPEAEKRVPQNIYRSKFLKKQFEKIDDEIEAEDENSPNYDPELYRKLSRAELAGLGISIFMMAYAFVNLDKPLFFCAMSLFMHLVRPFVGSFFGRYNRAVQNAMRSCSIVLFVGAMVLLFMMR